MKHSKQTYSRGNRSVAVIMMLTLLWLTVSTPFVYASEQQRDVYSQTNDTGNDLPDSEDSPFGNTTEEKTETGLNTLSEYLHYIDELSQLAAASLQHNISHDVAVYVAFHGEMLCPPPNCFRS